MNREYIHWHSPALGRTMEALVFGHAGRPVLVFPTSMGRYYQYEDFGMIRVLAPRIEAGHLQLFCIDSVDTESWYNRGVHPSWRGARHITYEDYILHEFLPFLRQRNPHADGLMVTGCSFGAYHAVNFAFRHPQIVRRVVGLGGRYDLRHLMGEYYDDHVYFNSPVDFMPGLEDPAYLHPLRHRMEIALLTGEFDICRDSTVELSQILSRKGIPHVLEVWGNGTGHDWSWWQQMIVKFVDSFFAKNTGS